MMTRERRKEIRFVLEDPIEINDGGVSRWFRTSLRDAVDSLDAKDKEIERLQDTIESLQARLIAAKIR